MVRRLLKAVLFGSLPLSLLGCFYERKPLPVEGTVRLDGQPIAAATVTFISQDADGRDAHGSTDAKGVFRLSTFKADDGALPGKYKVTIQPPPVEFEGPPAANPEEAMKAAAAGRSKAKKQPYTVPTHFTRGDQTPLTQDVPPTGPVTFDLKSK